jgi:alcohol dehydrogenase class IV
MNAFLTTCTGIDAMVNAVEAYVSLGHSPLTDLHALQAVRLISANLQKSIAEPNNLEYRSNMMLASLEAGLVFSNASLGAAHAMAHGLGGLLDLPHGQCNAMILDGVVDFNYGQAAQRYRDIAAAMGIEVGDIPSGELRKRLVAEIRRLRETASLGYTLSRIGVHRTEVHDLAGLDSGIEDQIPQDQQTSLQSRLAAVIPLSENPDHFSRTIANSRKLVTLYFVQSSIFNDLRLAFALQYDSGSWWFQVRTDDVENSEVGERGCRCMILLNP